MSASTQEIVRHVTKGDEPRKVLVVCPFDSRAFLIEAIKESVSRCTVITQQSHGKRNKKGKAKKDWEL